MKRTIGLFLLSLFFGLTMPTLSQAQTVQSGLAPVLPSASAAAYYYIAKPGELTMQINVWGFVKNPGRYEVPSTTDLVQLLSFAGGPVEYAKLDEVRIASAFSEGSKSPARVRSVNLQELQNLSENDLTLKPGDTVFIDHTSWLTVRDVFSVVTTAAIIASSIAQLVIAFSR
jgi:NADH:ubiquinone oxidoreductase subunit F (NADH-binding)